MAIGECPHCGWVTSARDYDLLRDKMREHTNDNHRGEAVRDNYKAQSGD